MDRLLERARASGLQEAFGAEVTRGAIEKALESARGSWRAGAAPPGEPAVLHAAGELLRAAFPPPLRSVINATGVVLHTNLGRAPLNARHLCEAATLLSGFVDLEFNLEEGERGGRGRRLETALQELLDTNYAAIAVNNNAAALLLALNTLSSGCETIVSRGELVEVGGGFRIPEVMAASGAVLREVGTTNRTNLEDYAGAVGRRTGLLLKVHPSNFRVLGFAEEVSLEELVALGRARRKPVAFDLGSGLLAPPKELGLPAGDGVREALSKGPQALCFSGDKLLGACQAGLLLVAPDLAPRFRSNHLLRALRVDKLSYLLLGRAVEAYRKGRWRELPALAMLSAPAAALRRRARALVRRIEAAAPGAFELEVSQGEGLVGGGAAPLAQLPSPCVSLLPKRGSVSLMEEFLRNGGNPPVVCVIGGDRIHLHMRTVLPGQDALLARRVATFTSGAREVNGDAL